MAWHWVINGQIADNDDVKAFKCYIAQYPKCNYDITKNKDIRLVIVETKF